jgi:putative membrane-bound dehydrogenase-like protein
MHAAALLALTCCFVSAPAQPAADPPTQVADSRLRLQVFAEAPDIVTPVGIAIDSRGRLFVVESHTHFPPAGYAGPKSDRIKIFEDTDGDGKADKSTIFYEGLRHTMNLEVAADQSLLVATRSEILRLRDTDGNGVADERTSLVQLETGGDYPHNGLSGFAIDFSGNIYFGFGENLGVKYKLIGAEGKTLRGGGEGGNIYRCASDGTQLVRIATGFWNPFHLCLDAYNNLFAVDNDPDSRPPCRLLHVVEDGDYGYRFRNGRKGTHPFTAWNGELPGTLPMVAGTGEAPSGIVAYESDNLPDDYRGNLLVTSWGDHRIERYALRKVGASFRAEMTPVVVGGENFRPVGIAVAPDGAVYFSDWVDKSYELHGKGRLWKLSLEGVVSAARPHDDASALRSRDRRVRETAARKLIGGAGDGRRVLRQELSGTSEARVRALALTALAHSRITNARDRAFIWDAVKSDPSSEVRALAIGSANSLGLDLEKIFANKPEPVEYAALLRVASTKEFVPRLVAELANPDPFVRQAAWSTLARSGYVDASYPIQSLKHPDQRAGIALLWRNSQDRRAISRIKQLLDDPDPSVRFVAIQWIGEEKLVDFTPQVREMLSQPNTTRLLFSATIAALERLEGGVRKPTDEWKSEDYVARVLLDPKSPAPVRRQALRTLRPTHPQLTLDLLRQLCADSDNGVRLEAIRTLRDSPYVERQAELFALANGGQFSEQERAEAVMGLAPTDAAAQDKLIDLAVEAPQVVAHEALRSLRGHALSEVQAARLKSAEGNRDPHWKELADRLLQTAAPAPLEATKLYAWLDRLEGPADAQVGERVFFHPRGVGCFRCHEVSGRGGITGPDLSTIGTTANRERIVESILQPSREVAPHFVAQTIVTADGRTVTALLISQEVDGTLVYVDSSGNELRLKAQEITDRVQSGKSIMPDNLSAQLTTQEFRDLIAFLRQQKQ